jgi:WD40 repeat protein
MQDISLLLRDARYVIRGYATPIHSHALQVYDSVLATGPDCKLLNYGRRSEIVVPRLVSERASDWSPVLQVIEGHKSGVNSIACSLDGSHIVSGSSDRTVRVWDAQTGKELAVLEGHKNHVRPVAFSPDGEHIISRELFGRELVWNFRGTVAPPKTLGPEVGSHFRRCGRW